METVIAYLLKMGLSSAILFGYYWLALRNERFHQWNRFYLLFAMLLSVAAPFISFPLAAEKEPEVIVSMVAAMPWNKVVTKGPAINTSSFITLAAALITAGFLLHLVSSIVGIIRMYRKNRHTFFRNVSVVITNESSAPFSFFKWLFWRSDIDPESSNGQRMLQHELTHISEKHSADKLFCQVLLAVFWMNPFFWLMRRELFAIHEFLADQKAFARHDGAAFAEMILQAVHPASNRPLTNPFFASQLKRRLVMITTSHAPKYTYLRRISGLILMLTTTMVLVLTIEQAQAQKAPPPPPPPVEAPPPPKPLPDSILSASVIDKNGNCTVVYKMKDGRRIVMPLTEVEKKGYPLPPPPPPTPAKPAPPTVTSGHEWEDAANGAERLTVRQNALKSLDQLQQNPDGDPLILYAGLEITKAQMNEIDPGKILSIDVIKNTSKYGEKGKNGVIVIEPKPAGHVPATNEIPLQGYGIKKEPLQEQVVIGYPGNDVLIIINGEKKTTETLKAIPGDQIKSINVLKDEAAIQKYGEEGKKGVVEIILKPMAVYNDGEKAPSFPGGTEAWRRYLEKVLQYPEQAQNKGTMGKVTLQFTVDIDGSLYDIKALNDPGDGLAEEAVRILKKGPKWVPAEKDGCVVKARTEQPITFRLQ